MIIVFGSCNKKVTDIDLMLSFIIFVNDILNRCLSNKQIGILTESASDNFKTFHRDGRLTFIALPAYQIRASRVFIDTNPCEMV